MSTHNDQLHELRGKLNAAACVYDALAEQYAAQAETVNDLLRQTNNMSAKVREWVQKIDELLEG